MSDREKRCQNILRGTILSLGLLSFGLQAEVINVPRDFVSIRSAVAAASDGDRIEVEDGLYFEENIIVDKAVHVLSKNRYKAIISGSHQRNSHFALIIIRAAAEIEGFILKNANDGIMQRNSPDVLWSAHDLIITNMDSSGILINAPAGNIGRAKVFNIVCDRMNSAFVTNDAHSLDVDNAWIMNCVSVTKGSNHLSFRADKLTIYNCRSIDDDTPDRARVRRPATNEVVFGPSVQVLDSAKSHSLPDGVVKDVIRALSQEPPERRALILSFLGTGSLEKGALVQSERFFRSSLRTAEEIGNPELCWLPKYGLALIREHQGRLKDASGFLDAAIDDIGRLQDRVAGTLFNVAFLLDKLEVYESAFRILDKEQAATKNDAPARKAFDIVERYKTAGALNLRQVILQAESRGSQDPGFAAEESRLSREISLVQLKLQKAISHRNMTWELINKLEKDEQDYLDLMRRMEKPAGSAYPGWLKPIQYQNVKEELLPGQTVLIEYFFGRNDVYAILATDREVSLVPLAKAATLAEEIHYYLLFLTLDPCGSFKGETGGRILFRKLLEPVMRKIPPNTKRLVIVPDGPLWSLPFETLIGPAGLDDSASGQGATGFEFLIKKYELAYAPSASGLIYATKRNGRSWDKDWLGLARLKEFPIPVMTLPVYFSGHLAHETDFPFPLSTLAWGREFPSLPGAVDEVQAVAGMFDRDRRTLLIGRGASESALKGLDLSRYRIIHLATHGIVDDIDWRHSALLLGADERSGEDGLLQSREIFRLGLKADLAVLSACRSSTADSEVSGGLSGLSFSFFMAGARSVLASLWPVNDTSTRQFMESFYRHARRGQGWADALREAKLEMLGSEYHHPYFWASFVLLGDGGQTLSR